MAEECLVALELGRTSPAFRSAFGTNVGIGSQGLVMFGTDAQKAEWLPGIASGEIITSFALTEPEAGSDSAAVQTRAVRDGDVYVLTGTKRFITNANKADLFTVMARTGRRGRAAASRPSSCRPTCRASAIGKPEKKMGQQGAHVCDVNFDEAPVPAENRLGEEGEGFKVAMQVLDRGRLHISAVCVGVAERLIADCVGLCDRAQAVRPADRRLPADPGDDRRLQDRGDGGPGAGPGDRGAQGRRAETSRWKRAAAKYFASEMVGRVADRAVQIFGGAGYIADYGIERFYRDVRIFRIYEGTSQIQQVIIARETIRNGG